MRRRLMDLARTQTEEMDFLFFELDSLWQRTFPSFAHAARHRLFLPTDGKEEEAAVTVDAAASVAASSAVAAAVTAVAADVVAAVHFQNLR